MTCKGICIRYKTNQPTKDGRYVNGQSRCQVCEIFIIIDGIFCPCCGYRVRKHPRNKKYKEKMRDKLS